MILKVFRTFVLFVFRPFNIGTMRCIFSSYSSVVEWLVSHLLIWSDELLELIITIKIDSETA